MRGLTHERAAWLAEACTPNGHPQDRKSIEATAAEIERLFNTAMLEGRIESAEEAAFAVIGEAQMRPDGWPGWPDLERFHALLRAMLAGYENRRVRASVVH